RNSEIVVECISKYGNFCECIDVDKYGDDLLIGVDSRLILNALKCISDEYAILEFTNEQGPIVIKPQEGEGFIYLVLPMILKNRD
ncbi:MAG: DNA polymerase III subunit beta, partial [Clostridia bacterium]|nr:DNA polymerase III subunit beta [Clostridia bacterium]